MTQEEYNQFLDNILFSRLQNYIIRARLEEVTQGFVYADDFLQDLFNHYWQKEEEFGEWFQQWGNYAIKVDLHGSQILFPQHYPICKTDSLDVVIRKLARMSRNVGAVCNALDKHKRTQTNMNRAEELLCRVEDSSWRKQNEWWMLIEEKCREEQLKGGASTTGTKQKDKGEDKENVCLVDLLPEELRVPKAVEVFKRAIDQGFIEQTSSGLEWTKTKALLTTFAEEMNKLIGLYCGLYDNQRKQVWAPYQDLFKVKQLAQAKKDYQRTGSIPQGTHEVIRLFSN